MLNIHLIRSDVWLIDGQSKLGCMFHACSKKDAVALQAELLRLIAAHTTDEAREYGTPGEDHGGRDR